MLKWFKKCLLQNKTGAGNIKKVLQYKHICCIHGCTIEVLKHGS